MRVLVITTVHHPLDARIYQRQIRSLVEAGIAVTYVAPWAETDSEPDLAPEQLAVRDVPRAAGRRRLRALISARRLIRELAARHDLVLLHDPELVFAAGGLRLPPVVLDVHEDLAASLPDRPWLPSWSRSLAVRFATALERGAERRFHLMLAERRYQERFRRPHAVVLNLPWLPSLPTPAGQVRRVVYVGRISAGRGAREMFAIGRQLSDRGGPAIELVGPVDTEVAGELDRAVADGAVTWHGFLPNHRALELVDGSVAGVSLLHDLPNYRQSMPTKVVEYMARGVPVVSTPLPGAADLLDESGAGFLVGFGDVEGVVNRVIELDGDPEMIRRVGGRGRATVEAGLCWDREAEAFVAHLRAIAGGR